jgi:amino acid adenylation domain-containing protein
VFELAAHRVFEAVAAQFPDRPAAVCGAERISYARLNGWANAVAVELRRHGLRSEEPVALAVPKSIGHVAAVLGVLKAGGAYVPIVANQPAERLRVILRDCRCRFALASGGYLDDVLATVPTRVDPASVGDRDAPNLDLDVRPEHLAYIMYTSGSTGVPKGVMIEHSGVVRLVHGQDYMPFGPSLNFLYGGPLSFDLSTIEIYTPLLHGGKLLISPDDVLTPEVVARYAETEDLNAVCVSFSLFRALFLADASAFERVPVIGVCGEPADPRFIRRAQERLPNARFYNAYGPTECTALTTTHQIPAPCPTEPPVVPIGRALNQMTLRVAGTGGGTVAEGEPGELYIGGVGLARGYLNDPELTAARFLSDPVSGARVYRSGDLVRRLPDGSLAYLGRIDDQVKVRGQRIELGEVDAVLTEDPQVAAAASVVLGTGESARVGACVVPAEPASFDAGVLTERLRRRLTAAMMPAVILPIASIPFNRNGKVDRQAVRTAIESDVRTSSASPTPAHRPPGTPTESTLLGICSAALGRPITSTAASFLQCGGNSLLAMVLRMRLRDGLDADVPLTDILAARDLASLARLVDARRGTGTAVFAPATPGPVPMAPAQQRLWTLHQLDPQDASYNIAYRFRMTSPPDRGALEAAWREAHARHPALRTAFPAASQAEPSAVLLDHMDPQVEWRTAPFADVPAERAEITRPFDLARPPLTRLIVWPAPEGAEGLLVMHHIVSDAWSMEVMFRDLAMLYRHHRDGVGPGLPDPGPGQPAHAVWQHERARSSDSRSSTEAAVASFAGCPATAGLLDEASRDAPAAVSTTFDVPANLVARVDALAAELGVSTHSVLLAAFACWAGPCCGTDEPIVGLAVSNRDDGPFADAVGFFVESVPVRFRLGRGTFRDLVVQASKLAREAHARRDVGFDQFCRRLPGQPSLTNVFFNVIDPAPIDRSGTESVIQHLAEEVDHALARFDLLCTVYRDAAAGRCRITVAARDARWLRGAPPSAEELGAVIRDAVSDPGRQLAAAARPGREIVSAGSGAVSDADAGRDQVMRTIVDVFREVLADPEIGPDDDFFARGGDSLRAVRGFAMIRERTRTSLTAAVMFKHVTARQLAERVRENEPAGHRGFVALTPPGRAQSALLLPGISGEIVSMRELVSGMGDDWSCQAALYPTEPPAGADSWSLDRTVEYLRSAIGDDFDPTRTDLIGYSYGGIVAYELAVRLQQEGRAPRRLVIIDAYVITRDDLPPLRTRLVRRVLKHLRLHRKASSKTPGKSRAQHGGSPASEAQQQLLRDRRRSIEHYQPTSPYRGEVVVIQANQPEWLGPQIVRSANGWRNWLALPPTTIPLTCTHGAILKGEAAEQIAAVINRGRESAAMDTAQPPPASAGDTQRDAVLSILREVLQRPELSSSDDFFEYGGNSLSAVRAFSAIRQRFGVNLPIATIFQHATASRLAEIIRSAATPAGSDRSRSVVRLTAATSTGNAVLFPGVSGETTSLQALVRAMAQSTTVHAADYPGTSEGQPPATSLHELVARFTRDIPEGRPLLFVGYSFGGIVAYEAAVELGRRGRPPDLLVLIDSYLLDRFPKPRNRGPGDHLRNLARLPVAEMPRYVSRRAARAAAAVRDRLLGRESYEGRPHIRDLVAAHLSLLEGYKPSARYDGRVLAIRGRRPDWLLAHQDDGLLGWRDALVRDPAVVDVDADHDGLLSADAARTIADAVRVQLTEP